MKTLIKALMHCPATLGFAFMFSLCSYFVLDQWGNGIAMFAGMLAIVFFIGTVGAAINWKETES
jgi:hypothetical protein